MRVHKDLDSFKGIKRPIITMGMFDGVHLGHQKILNHLKDRAKSFDGESVLLSFDQHPRLVLQKDSGLKLIYGPRLKEECLEAIGLDHLVILEFNKAFSRLTALEFVRDILVEKLNVFCLIVGHDHQFGKNREGNFEELSKFANMFDFKLEQLPAVLENDKAISSTKIRTALTKGDLTYCQKALGRHFSLYAKVKRGDQIGRQLGFPTANLDIDERQILPKNGAYFVQVGIDNMSYKGMLNIGMRPSVSGDHLQAEVHILDYEGDLYDATIKVSFIERLRDEIAFESLDALKDQLKKDREIVLSKPESDG